MRTLVVGCDASGKFTLLNTIHQSYGDIVIESTSTDESRAFKHASLNRLVDADFISERERLYMGLAKASLEFVRTNAIEDFVSTDGALVTRLSHAVMHRSIGGDSFTPDDIVADWLSDEAESGVQLPDIVALTHAPFPAIVDRISIRQRGGQKDEKFWGFNSPFFLNHYQEAWKSTLPALARAGFTCLAFDTTLHTPAEMIDEYRRTRSSLHVAPSMLH